MTRFGGGGPPTLKLRRDKPAFPIGMHRDFSLRVIGGASCAREEIRRGTVPMEGATPIEGTAPIKGIGAQKARVLKTQVQKAQMRRTQMMALQRSENGSR